MLTPWPATLVYSHIRLSIHIMILHVTAPLWQHCPPLCIIAASAAPSWLLTYTVVHLASHLTLVVPSTSLWYQKRGGGRCMGKGIIGMPQPSWVHRLSCFMLRGVACDLWFRMIVSPHYNIQKSIQHLLHLDTVTGRQAQWHWKILDEGQRAVCHSKHLGITMQVDLSSTCSVLHHPNNIHHSPT